MHCPTLQLRKPRVESRNALINLCTRVTQTMTMIATVVAMMVMIVIVMMTTTTTMAILSIDVTSEVGHLVWRATHSCARKKMRVCDLGGLVVEEV